MRKHKKMMTFLGLFIVLAILLLIYIKINFPFRTKPFGREILSSKIVSNPTSRKDMSPDYFLSTPAKIEVKYIHSGDLKEVLSDLINLKDPKCAGIKDKDITIPIFAYLIHHETYGYFLIDTGCDSAYINKPFGNMKGFLFPMVQSKTVLNPEDAIERQMADVMSEIKGVFFTHLHFDHTSGVPSLPDHLIYVAGKGEQSYAYPFIINAKHFKKTDTVYMMDFKSSDAVDSPLGKVIDIFGDQSLWAISTPGHSRGHVSYLVNTEEGPILIAGDAILSNLNMELGVSIGKKSADSKQAQRTFDRLYEFVKQHPEVNVWAGHDYPEQ